MRITKEQKAITLIALVITIIILLILAGVALATLTGNGSIIDNANYAVTEYNKSAGNDQNVLNQVENLFAKYMGGSGDDDDDGPTLPKVDANGLATEPYKVVADKENNLQIVIPEGFAPAILNGSNSTTSSPGEDGSVKNIMPAEQWSSITAAQINAGVVIVNEAGEEFVWVPIPRTSDFTKFGWTTYGYNSSGNWLYDTRTEQPLANTETENAWWEDTNTTEYINMVNSVNTNKGFYISRYEASNNGSNVAQSKRGQPVWLSIAQCNPSNTTDALRASLANNKTNTHLVYGIEWDSILKWLQRTEAKTLVEIQTNSNTWGNYSDSASPANTNPPYVQYQIQNTGASEYWKVNNIYDLAGNVFEWTQEKWSNGWEDGNRACYRGGVFNAGGEYDPVAYRSQSREVVTNEPIRFQIQFLLVM